MALSWQCTFIGDWCDALDLPNARNIRSHSAPCRGSADVADELFGEQREYVATLASRCATLFSKAEAKHSPSSVVRNLKDQCLSPFAFGSSHSTRMGSDSCSDTGSMISSCPAPSDLSTTASRAHVANICTKGGSPRGLHSRGRPPMGSEIPQGVPRPVLRGPTLLDQGPLRRTVSVMEALPERLEDTLLKQTLNVVRDVQTRVSELCCDIMSRSSRLDAGSHSAITQLVAIPDMVTKDLSHATAQAVQTVTELIRSIPQHGTEPTRADHLSHDVMTKIAAIPGEVGEATSQALGEALCRTQVTALRQVDRALATLAPTEPLSDSGDRLLSSLRKIPREAMVNKAVAAAEHAVVTAVAAGKALSNNEQVAQAILRGRIEGSTTKTATNPGSAGHPTLCVRPCIFFAQGACKSGDDCSYCHGGHEAKVRHLDKQGRMSMRKLSFSQRVVLALPILRSLATAGGFADRAEGVLSALRQSAEDAIAGQADRETEALMPVARAKLAKALPALGFRSVFLHVCNGEGAPEHFAPENLQAILAGMCAGSPAW